MPPLQMEFDPRARNKLKNFLAKHLDYEMVSEHLARELTEILQYNLAEEQADSAHTLAQECARKEPHAVDTVNKIS